MDNLPAVIITGGVLLLPFLTLCWTIAWTIISSMRQARAEKENTKQLNQIQKDVEQSNRLHNQSVQRLYRAREAIITMHKALSYMNHLSQFDVNVNNEAAATKTAELFAAVSELKGIAFAINDNGLVQQITNGLLDLSTSDKQKDLEENTIKTNALTEQLHMRVTQLLEEATRM